MRHALAAVAAVLVLGSGSAVQAQSFDCAKARTPVELTICASPGLRDQDRAMAEAFTAALAREPAKADELRKAQRAWLTGRGKACVTPDAAPTKITACLIGLYRARLASLQTAPGPIPSLNTAGRPPVGAPVQPPLPLIAAALLPKPLVTMPAVPPLPQVPAGAGAALSRPSVPAGAAADALLSVTEAGRFVLRAESTTGVALQLVDMATGPGDIAGEAGQRDGRLDVLLDRGTYKLRSTGAAGAPGEAKLSVVPFRETAPASSAMFYGGEMHGMLADLEQRSFWVATAADGQIAVEAVGRSLADMRLWLNGTDLAAVAPEFRLVEPKPGRPAMRARLSGRVEPGIYLVTTYGGPAQKWVDGDTAQALHVRSGPPESVAAGWLEGTIGPFGTARFVLPAAGGTVRLELPEPAAARIALVRGGSAAATIARNSREPVASIAAPANPNEPPVVEVTGQEGQPFRLRVLRPSGALRFSGTGPHLVSAEVAGEGGDEFPAAAVLVRFEGARGQVMAAVAPQVGPAQAWRRKFNFRGTTATPFEVTAAMALALRSQGPAIKATIEPLAGGTPPRTGAAAPLRWELEPGWYSLRIEPVGGASGVLDLTLGPQGLQPELAPAAAPRAALALGTVTLDRTAGYGVLASAAPGLIVAPVARPLPAMLEGAPLLLVQEPGQALTVPVRMPARGALAVAQPDGVPVPVELNGDSVAATVRSVTLRVPAPERRRTLIVSWSDPQAAVPAAAKLASLAPPEPIAAGTPRHFDLAKDESRSFQLGVAEGGLYRLETLGRLKTTLALATAFQPGLGTAEANGAGQNALLQSYLRAGRYRVVVGAKESTGRLGLTAVPAALDGAATLTSGGSVRAALAGGRGLIVPVEIATAGTYRLILDGLDRTFSARLEDAEGWPLTAPGPLD
ncbi:MAG: lysozyme inhibitor LprI family protein, partial [Alsobacter sp.]